LTSASNEDFGLKRISLENWLKAEPAWRFFGVLAELPNPSDPWVEEILSFDLVLDYHEMSFHVAATRLEPSPQTTDD